MNLSHIQAFVEVAKLGSVSEAARQLGFNRTRLSMGIKALEKELDTELFIRRATTSLSLRQVRPFSRIASLYSSLETGSSRLASTLKERLLPRSGLPETILFQTIFGRAYLTN